jgi:hypothetical protein
LEAKQKVRNLWRGRKKPNPELYQTNSSNKTSGVSRFR